MKKYLRYLFYSSLQHARNFKIALQQWSRRIYLKHKDFTIISNNCWGGFTYQRYGLPYKTPTIGLFILGADFVKFCGNLDYYLSRKLRFIPWEKSRWVTEEKLGGVAFPVGMLDDIEIYFMHYASEVEAAEKWNRRKNRINRKRMIFKFSQRGSCSKEIVEAFMALPYKNKICFAYDKIPGTIYCHELKGLQGDEMPIVSKALNIDEYLNNIE